MMSPLSLCGAGAEGIKGLVCSKISDRRWLPHTSAPPLFDVNKDTHTLLIGCL